MEINTHLLILIIEAPIAIIGGYLWYQLRQIMKKIEHIDNTSKEYMTQTQIRVLIADKLEPLRQKDNVLAEGLRKLDEKIDKILEHLVR